MLIGISGYIGSGKDTVAAMIQYLILHNNHPDEFGDPDYTYEKFATRGHKLFSTWEIKKFAGKLKQIVSLLTGISVENLEKQEVKDSILGPEWDYKWVYDAGWDKRWTAELPIPYFKEPVIKMTVRSLLQRLGTDAMRDVVHPNIHVNALFADYKFEGCKNTGESCDTPNGNCDSKLCYPNWLLSDMRFPNEMQAVKDRKGFTVRINRDYMLSGGPSDPSKLHPSETALDKAEFDYVIENNAGIPELLEQVKQMLITFKII